MIVPSPSQHVLFPQGGAVARGPSDHPIPWRSIEIHREPWGGCSVLLGGNAAALARDQQLTDFQVSISHEPEYAIATVVATRVGEVERETTP